MADVWSYFANEGDYPDLGEGALAERLAAALAIPTVDGRTADETDWTQSERLVSLFRENYPRVFAAASEERVDHSLVLTIPGSDPSLDPVVFMGHMDVVPVVEGTEGDWDHGPFSGDIADGYVWGRGALDMKDQVVGELEAAEYALSHGWELRRTLMLCLGQDEESLQTGARAIGRMLKERGTRVEFLVDEGDYLVADTAPYGVPGHHGLRVNLAEKGYADVRLTVRGEGGHSSNPFGGTTLAILAEAISRVANDPWPVELTELDRQMLAAVAPWITSGPLAPLVSPRPGETHRDAIDRNADGIAQAFLRDADLFPFVTTTVAPTMIEGGSQQANVMPQDMTATINFRMLPGVGCDRVLSRVRELVADLPVEVELLEDVSNDPSKTSRSDGWGFKVLERVAARYFREPGGGEPLTLIPAMVCGASDARMYEGVCDSCLRFSAFVADDEEVARGVHGTNERITTRAYAQGGRFMIGVIREALL